MKFFVFFIVLFLILPVFVFSGVLAQEVNHNIEDEGLINCGKGKTTEELAGKGLYDSTDRNKSLTIRKAREALNDEKRVYSHLNVKISCGIEENCITIQEAELADKDLYDSQNKSLTIRKAREALNDEKRVYSNLNVKISCGIEENCITIQEFEALSECNFEDAGNLLLRVVNWLIFIIAPTAVLIMISIGGFIVLISESANPGSKKKGMNMIKYALLGYIIILFSVLIIDQMIAAIGVSNDALLDWKNFKNRL